jgi:hypothetical protein
MAFKFHQVIHKLKDLDFQREYMLCLKVSLLINHFILNKLEV